MEVKMPLLLRDPEQKWVSAISGIEYLRSRIGYSPSIFKQTQPGTLNVKRELKHN